MKVVTVSICTALLVCRFAPAVHAEIKGAQAVPNVPIPVPYKPRAQQVGLRCPAGDQCCKYSASAAECSSTESASKGCRSHTTCVARVDPCSSATDGSSCLSASSLCRFNKDHDTCTLDTSLHPCSEITDLDECEASSSCKVVHTCLQSCTHCLKCLDATRMFAQLPAMLRTLEATGGDHVQLFKGFCLSTAMGIDPSMRSEIILGCDQIIADTVKSPGLLQRPGALCARLGICHTGCVTAASYSNSEGTAEQNTTTSTAATVSMCSPTGWAISPDATSTAAATASAPDGTAATAVAAGGGAAASDCLTSDDCVGGLACDTFSQPRCHPGCDEKTGMDKCIAAGVCVDYCERPDIKMAVQDSRKRFRACTTAADCNSGEQCGLPDFPCKLLSCSNAAASSNAGDPLQITNCSTICLPERPRMISARFSDNGQSIEVLLNQEAAPVEALCAYIFDEATSPLLGAFSRCTTRGNKLTIWLAGDVGIRPGQHTLTISRRNGLLASVLGVNSETGAPVFAGGLENGTNVLSCADCSKSAVPVTLTGPAEVSLPCDGEAPPSTPPHAMTALGLNPQWPWPPEQSTGFTFTALIPADKMWMVQDVQWAVVGDQQNVTVLQQLIAAVNSKPHARDRQSLSIPVEALPTLPEASITLSVTVANVFNISSASNFTFSKQNSSQAPTFELDKSLTQFHPSQGFRVVANRLPSSCRATAGAGDEVWEWSTDIPGVRLDGVQTTRLVFPPADLVGNVELGKDYNITLKAYYSGSDVTATDTLTLRAVGSPLEAHLSGLSGSVPMLQGNLTYDASESRDPDDPDDAATEMSYLWSCYNTVDRSPCFGMQQGTATWVLDPSKLTPDQSYTVSVTVAKGSRNTTSSTTIKPMTQPTPSGRIARFCGLQTAPYDTSGLDTQQVELIQDPATYLAAELEAVFTGSNSPWSPRMASAYHEQPVGRPSAKPCPAKHNPTDPLTLVVTPDPAYTDAVFTWWLDPASKPGVMLSESNTMAGVNGNTVTILPGALPAGGSVTVHVNMSMSGQAGSVLIGSSSITVPLNTPPYCSSAPLFKCTLLNTTTGTFPTAKFHAWATGWADADQANLNFEFGVLTDELGPQVLASGDSNTHTFSHLLPGNNTIYVCAIDSFGARACERTVVTVRRPQTSWDVHLLEDKILSLDLGFGRGGQQYDDTEEEIVPTSAVDVALQMASLLAYSVTDVVNSVGGFLGFLQDGTRRSRAAGTPVLAYKPSIQNATNKVLVALARSGQGVDDTDELDSLLTAAAKLGMVTRTNTRGGRALLNLYRRTMRANRKGQKLPTPQKLNTYTDAFTTGLAAATAAGSASIATTANRPNLRPRSAKTPADPVSAVTLSRHQQPRAEQRSLLATDPAASTRDSSNRLPKSSIDTQMSPRSLKFQPPASPFTATQAYQFLLDGARRLSAAQDVTLNAPAVAVGNHGVCSATALLQQQHVSGFGVSFGCPGVDNSPEVVLPESFASSCSSNRVCLHSGPFLVSSQYYSFEGPLADIIVGVVQSRDKMIERDGRRMDTLVVSGVLNVTLNYTTPEGTFCPVHKSASNKTAAATSAAAASDAAPANRILLANPQPVEDRLPTPSSSNVSYAVSVTTFNNSFDANKSSQAADVESKPCLVTLKFPIDPELYDASKTLECVYLAPRGYSRRSLTAAASYPVTSVVQKAAVQPRSAATAAVKYLYGRLPGVEDSSSTATAVKEAHAEHVVTEAKPTQPAAVTSTRAVVYAECQVPQQGLYVIVQWPTNSQSVVPDFTSDSVPGAFTAAPVQRSSTVITTSSDAAVASSSSDRTQTAANQPVSTAAAAAQQADLPSIQFQFTFQVGYHQLAADPVLLDSFRTQLQQTVLTGLAGIWADGPSLADPDGALQLRYVTVSNIRPSSGVITSNAGNSGSSSATGGVYTEQLTDVDVWFMPPQGSSSLQVDQLAALSPVDLLSSNSGLQAMLVTAQVVGSSYEHRTVDAAVVAGAVVSAVVALAAAVGISVVIIHRCRRTRHSISGRNNSSSNNDSDDTSANFTPYTAGAEGKDLRVCNSGAETPPGDHTYTWPDSSSKQQGTGDRTGYYSPRNVRENPLHEGAKALVPGQVVHHNYVFYCADELLAGDSRVQTPAPVAAEQVGGIDDVGDIAAGGDERDGGGSTADDFGTAALDVESREQQQQTPGGPRQPATL